jgi:carboxyl-terminal processing protease
MDSTEPPTQRHSAVIRPIVPVPASRPLDNDAPSVGIPPQPPATQPVPTPERRMSAGSLSRTLTFLLVLSGMLFMFSGGMLVQRVFLTPDAQAAEPTVPAAIARAWELINTRYVDSAAVNEQRMTEAAIVGMLDTLGDQGHTRYLTAEQAQRETEQLSGGYSGVGVQVEQRDGQIVVVTPLDNSPAMEAGVLPGDILVSIDGRDVRGQSVDDVIPVIRGEEGTSVLLGFERPSENRVIEFELVRRRITISAVSWTMLDNQHAVIRLSQFSSGAGNDIQRALDAARAAGATGIVLDLRNNPGGYVSEAIQVASTFVPADSTIFLSQFRDGSRNPHLATPQPTHIGDTPLVVLINEGSASSSEITSGAIQANNPHATVIGETTFGTGTVLNSFPLGDGSSILLGTELWLTPQGDFIRESGVRPDVVVGLQPGQTPFLPSFSHAAPENGQLNDYQLEWALDLLRTNQAGASSPSLGTPPTRAQ